MNTKLWKILIVVLVISTSAFGQQRGQPGPPPIPNSKQIEKMVSDLADEILLSNEQEVKVLELYTTHFETVNEKIEASKPKREEMEALKNGFVHDVKAVLTKEQQELYTSYMKKNRPKKGGKERRN